MNDWTHAMNIKNENPANNLIKGNETKQKQWQKESDIEQKENEKKNRYEVIKKEKQPGRQEVGWAGAWKYTLTHIVHFLQSNTTLNEID